ncbi:MAG: hypothetical protein J2P49_05105 [Methylocapsa sp.]|nr:hypothetical protein [Methylocapsa sp.]
MRGHRVGPCVAKRTKARALVRDCRKRVETIAGRARHPVEPRATSTLRPTVRRFSTSFLHKKALVFKGSVLSAQSSCAVSKIAEKQSHELGDISTLADPAVVEDLMRTRID